MRGPLLGCIVCSEAARDLAATCRCTCPAACTIPGWSRHAVRACLHTASFVSCAARTPRQPWPLPARRARRAQHRPLRLARRRPPAPARPPLHAAWAPAWCLPGRPLPSSRACCRGAARVSGQSFWSGRRRRQAAAAARGARGLPTARGAGRREGPTTGQLPARWHPIPAAPARSRAPMGVAAAPAAGGACRCGLAIVLGIGWSGRHPPCLPEAAALPQSPTTLH